MNQNFRKTALLMGAMVLLGLGYSSNANAAGAPQEIQQATKKITGTVVDAQGPVIGASVVEKGTTNGTVTDFDGNFSLNVKEGATIVISFIGFETQEVKIGSQDSYNITMRDDNAVLEEVVGNSSGESHAPIIATYVYDDHGNWVRRTTAGVSSPTILEVRTFRYYDE